MRKSVQTDICPDAGFVRSGYVHLALTTGTSRYAGDTGDWWSSRGDIAAGAYNFYFNATGILPSGGPSDRYFAFPLRCLSTVLGM